MTGERRQHNLRVVSLEDDRFTRPTIVSDLKAGSITAWATGNEMEFFVLIKDRQPDVVILDLKLGRHDLGYKGLEYIKQVKQQWPNMKCVVLTSFPIPVNFRKAVAAGADSFVIKDPTTDLADIVKRTANGECVFDPELVKAVALDDASRPVRDGSPLTPREIDILHELEQGKSNEEIAAALGIAKDTVKSHLKPIFRKLGVSDRRDAVLSWKTKK